MTKKNSLKRSLIASIVILCLCFTSLIGTTFAWFTDSVTSANNIIQTGTLDVKLEYSVLKDGAWTDYAEVTDATDVFGYNNWEPGYVAVAKFKITNVGTLALKYVLSADIYSETPGKNVDGEEFFLSDSLYTKVVPTSATREQILAYTDGNKFNSNVVVSNATTLDKGASVETALAIWMPTTVGNEANYREVQPSITFGINLIATQTANEEDSFGPDYDEDAVYGDAFVADAVDLANAIVNAENGDVIVLMDDIDLTSRTRAASPFALEIAKGKSLTINLNGNTISGTSANDSGNQGLFRVKGDLAIEGEGSLVIEPTGANMGWGALSAVFSVEGGSLTLGEGVVASHKGGTDMAYVVDVNSTLGETVLNVNGAILDSTYVGVRLFNNHNTAKAIVNVNSGVIDGPRRDIWKQYDKPAEINIADGIAYTNENEYEYFFGTAVAGTSSDLNAAIADNAEIVLTGGEFTLPTLSGKTGVTIVGAADGSTVIGGENTATGFGGNFGKDTTIKNVTFAGSSNGARWTYANGGTSTFENCTFAGDSTYGFHMDQSNGATLIFNNCTFSGFNAFAGDLVKVVFNNCTFLHNGNYGHTNIWSVAEFNNCTFGDKASVGQGKDSGAKLYFNGVEESYHHEYVGSAESLFAFAETVNVGNDAWNGQAVILVADIDLENALWTPIGQTGATQFQGTFDGQGYTIKNLKVDSLAQTGAHYSSGLFGWLNHATVKNVNVDGATISGNHNVAVIAGYMETAGCTISNCHVANATIVAKHANDDACGDKVGVIVGHAGNTGVVVENCSAKDSTVVAGRDAGQIAGAAKAANVIGCTAENVTVTAGGDCTGANINNAVIGRTL